MLGLDDPRWTELRHAYGTASDTPNVLRQLRSTSVSTDREEPWFTLWSSLAHQGDVYSASFAACPTLSESWLALRQRATRRFFSFLRGWRYAVGERAFPFPITSRRHISQHFASCPLWLRMPQQQNGMTRCFLRIVSDCSGQGTNSNRGSGVGVGHQDRRGVPNMVSGEVTEADSEDCSLARSPQRFIVGLT